MTTDVYSDEHPAPQSLLKDEHERECVDRRKTMKEFVCLKLKPIHTQLSIYWAVLFMFVVGLLGGNVYTGNVNAHQQEQIKQNAERIETTAESFQEHHEELVERLDKQDVKIEKQDNKLDKIMEGIIRLQTEMEQVEEKL